MRILKFRVLELKEFLYLRNLQFQWLLNFLLKNPQIISNFCGKNSELLDVKEKHRTAIKKADKDSWGVF